MNAPERRADGSQPLPEPAWIVSEGRVLASCEVASSVVARTRGLLRRDHLDGAIVLENTRWVHSIGMRFDLDVAYLDKAGTVIRVHHLPANRVARPVLGARAVIEAEVGAFVRWGLVVGMNIEIRR